MLSADLKPTQQYGPKSDQLIIIEEIPFGITFTENLENCQYSYKISRLFLLFNKFRDNSRKI